MKIFFKQKQFIAGDFLAAHVTSRSVENSNAPGLEFYEAIIKHSFRFCGRFVLIAFERCCCKHRERSLKPREEQEFGSVGIKVGYGNA